MKSERIVYKVYKSGHHYDNKNNCWTRKKTYEWPIFYNLKEAIKFANIGDFIIEMKISNSKISSTISEVV